MEQIFNEERKKVGLPMLPENWRYDKIIGGDGNAERWLNPNQKYPCHFQKLVEFDNNKQIIYETDLYYGVNKYPSVDRDNTMTERLTISYYFQDENREKRWRTEKLKKKGWNCNFECQKTENSGNTEITKEQADSILVLWGL